MWIQLVQISMIFLVMYFLCVGGGGGTGWGGVSRNSDEARKNTECLCLPSHDFPYRSLPPNSVLYLPTRQTPERFPSSDHCKPCSVSLVISYSVSQGRLRASGNEAIASPAFVSSPSKGRFPKSVLSYTCGCTDTPWLSVPLIARPKWGPQKDGFIPWTAFCLFSFYSIAPS